MKSRRAFTLIEVMFVMAVASVIMMVLMNILRNVNVGAHKAEAKLDFLRKSTILLDRLRADIRSAGRGTSITATPKKSVKIEREAPGGKGEAPVKQTVTYEWDEATRVVVRTVQGGVDESDTYGQAGPGKGFITEFDVGMQDPTLPGPDGQERKVTGFYGVTLKFATEQELQDAEKSGAKVEGKNVFRALVSKRAPEVTDDLWKPN